MSLPSHIPVMVDEVLHFISPKPGGTYIDGTVGYAGHAEAILTGCGAGCRLLGIDADAKAIDSARVQLSSFAGRVELVCAYFDGMKEIATRKSFIPADGILFDLGLSSPQLADSSRGFSFQSEGPLDMRMGPGLSAGAAEILASSSEEELARIFYEYGEERFSRRIARRVVTERQIRLVETTDDLARLVSRAVPRTTRSSRRIHPATRVFQALRIAVNDELERLKRVLPDCLSLLRHGGGRLVVITFHSLEDRIVKQFMQAQAAAVPASLRILTKKPVLPSKEEVRANPRSRSAKLRAAEAI